jgi:hypothetical protein
LIGLPDRLDPIGRLKLAFSNAAFVSIAQGEIERLVQKVETRRNRRENILGREQSIEPIGQIPD